MYNPDLRIVAPECGCLDRQSLLEACCSRKTSDQMDLGILMAFGEISHLRDYYHLKQNQERAIHHHPFASVVVLVKSSQ